MNHIITLLKTGHMAAASLLLFGLAGAGAQASHAVDHSQGYKAMSIGVELVTSYPLSRNQVRLSRESPSRDLTSPDSRGPRR
jgi:hypothetical protein